jgi:nucleotide-binding universal stress UspA family protein
MSMKTILVPTDNYDAMQSVLETALLVARRFDSYIEGFALRWVINEYVAGVEMMGGIPMERYEQDIAKASKQARQIFESFMEKHDVPRSNKATKSMSFGWVDEPPEGEGFVGSYGRVFDMIVMNRPNANSTSLYNRAIESGLFESGRPILLSPPSPPQQIASNVLIAWNCSTEQARAIALAMPLLQKAERVTVLTIIGGTGVPGPSDEQLIRYLQRNEIVAEPLQVELDGKNTGETVLATAKSLGCDLLIKGAYTQSRLRQMIFGGATQHILDNAALPVLLAN